MPPLAIIALGATGLGLGIKGTLDAGRAAEDQARNAAAWHEYNAKLAERQGKEAQAAAAHEEKQHRKAGSRLKAKQRMGFLASGVTLEGTSLDFLEEQAAEIETDALMIRRSGMAARQAGQSGAAIERGLGRSAILQGKNKRRASLYSAAGTGFSGGAGLGYQYGSMTGKY
jgi:hypothetical protein